MLYAAYGEMLCKSMRDTVCPDSKVVATGMLHGWKLVFKTHEDIETDEDSSVPVIVLEVDEDDVKQLDKCHERGKYYDGKLVNVSVLSSVDGSTNDVTAFTYVMMPRYDKYQRPSEWYLNLIKSGYMENGFDVSQLDNIVEHM